MGDNSNQTFIDNFISSNFNTNELRINNTDSNINNFLYSYNKLSFYYIDKLLNNSNKDNTEIFINYLCFKCLSNCNEDKDNCSNIRKNIKPIMRNLFIYDETNKNPDNSYYNTFSNLITSNDLFEKTSNYSNIGNNDNIYSNLNIPNLIKSEIFKVNKIFDIDVSSNSSIYIDKNNNYLFLFKNNDDCDIYKYYDNKWLLHSSNLELNKSNINEFTQKNDKYFNSNIILNNIKNDIFSTYNPICSKIINNILLLNNEDFNKLKLGYSNFISLK